MGMYEFIARNLKQINKQCPKHAEAMYVIKAKGIEVCMSCAREAIEKDEQKAQEEFRQQEDARQEAIRKNVLYKSSLVSPDLRNATLSNYRATDQKQKEKLDRAIELANSYINGDEANVLFLGQPGTGKSHLAYGIIKRVSDTTKKQAMFIKIPELLARIKSDFGTQDSQQKWIEKMTKIPYLVLDDLGTEKVTDWSKEILFSVLDNRNRTIVTSNLTSSQEIGALYGEAIKDRICKGVDKRHGLLFEGMKSQRRTYF